MLGCSYSRTIRFAGFPMDFRCSPLFKLFVIRTFSVAALLYCMCKFFWRTSAFSRGSSFSKTPEFYIKKPFLLKSTRKIIFLQLDSRICSSEVSPHPQVFFLQTQRMNHIALARKGILEKIAKLCCERAK